MDIPLPPASLVPPAHHLNTIWITSYIVISWHLPESPFSTQVQTTNPWISDFTSIFYTFSNEKTSTKSFGLDSQGRGFRTEFTKTWRWIIRHGHQTHHVRPKGNENPPIRKRQGVSPWSPWHLTLDASATRSKVQGSFWLSAMPCCTTMIMGNSNSVNIILIFKFQAETWVSTFILAVLAKKQWQGCHQWVVSYSQLLLLTSTTGFITEPKWAFVLERQWPPK